MLLARLILILGLVPALQGGPAPAAAQDRSEDATVVFLVRHAEKADDGSRDPALTGPGRERAKTLARVLGDTDLTHVFTSDFRRTRGTAAPTARAHGLKPVLYDATELSGLAERLRATPGRHLVVGHSNTTPEVVRLLGGDPGEPMDEAHEYDRLYVVVLHPGGGAATALLRYGDPRPPRED